MKLPSPECPKHPLKGGLGQALSGMGVNRKLHLYSFDILLIVVRDTIEFHPGKYLGERCSGLDGCRETKASPVRDLVWLFTDRAPDYFNLVAR
jgi:hypothetical protein